MTSEMKLAIAAFSLLFLADRIAGELSAAERSTVLRLHNDYRQQLAGGRAANKDGSNLPSGKNIYKLKYSDELEQSAQSWASNCKFEHSKMKQRAGAGQNIFSVGAEVSATEALKKAATAWWSELQDHGIESDLILSSQMFSRGVGHFTQMAWGATTQLGCGVKYCAGTSPMTLVVCHYLKAGNTLDSPIYERGAGCRSNSDCTTHADSTCDKKSKLCMDSSSQ